MESVLRSDVSTETSLDPESGSFLMPKIEEIPLSALEQLILRSQETLFEAQSIFPLDIVPDRLIIDMSKVTIMYRDFFNIGTEHTILLNEVRDVDVENYLITASLRILVSGPGVIWTTIENLHKCDAMKAKHLIEGLLLARAEHIDFQELGHVDRIAKITALGTWNHLRK
jgi:hypothetical protein